MAAFQSTIAILNAMTSMGVFVVSERCATPTLHDYFVFLNVRRMHVGDYYCKTRCE